MTFFNNRLGIKTQALPLPGYITEIDYELLGIKNKYDFYIITSVFNNTRKNGIGMEIIPRITFNTKERLYIYFEQDRHSGDIFVANWKMPQNKKNVNVVSFKDFNNEIRKHFIKEGYTKASAYIREIIKLYVTEIYIQCNDLVDLIR